MSISFKKFRNSNLTVTLFGLILREEKLFFWSGVAYCALCGHALCSCGTVYKGEREKYWYLSCINKRKDINEPCKELLELSEEAVLTSKSDNYKMFFELTRQHTHIETLDRDTLLTFVDRIEVGPKILPEGKVKARDKTPNTVV